MKHETQMAGPMGIKLLAKTLCANTQSEHVRFGARNVSLFNLNSMVGIRVRALGA